MKDKQFYKRLNNSARDFVSGVQPVLEKCLGIEVHPIEDLKHSQLMRILDQRGIDAFYYDQNGEMRGLASRVNYSKFVSRIPSFTFRYKLWDAKRNDWDENREYARKLHAANSPEEFILFPKIHVESYVQSPGSGLTGWAFAAETKIILNYIKDNLDNPTKVRTFKPKTGEKREVICVPVEVFAREHKVTEVIGVRR